MSRSFAAFDIDGTIARSGIFFQVVDELIARNHLPQDFRAELDEKYERYRQRTHTKAFAEYSQHSVNLLLSNISTLNVADYRKTVDAIIPTISKYTYVYTTQLIKQLKEDGYFLIAISGSEMYSVQKFAEKFDFDVAIGEIYHEDNEKFSGEVETVVHKKDEYIKKLIKKHNLTLKNSIAVGDGWGDKSMLELVEKPIAFNPEDRLFLLAQKNRWDIVVERKNVIYELKDSNGHYQLS